MGSKSSDVRFDLGQDQTRIAKLYIVLITHLLLVLEVCNVKHTNLYEIMGCESSDVVRFDLDPILQGQTRITKLKSAYNWLIIGPRCLQCETNIWEIMGGESDLTLGPSLKVKRGWPNL